MEELQRKIEEAPKLAQAEQERQRQERIERATTRRSPLDSPDILQDSRHGEDLFAERPRRQRRAQRRQARLAPVDFKLGGPDSGSHCYFPGDPDVQSHVKKCAVPVQDGNPPSRRLNLSNWHGSPTTDNSLTTDTDTGTGTAQNEGL